MKRKIKLPFSGLSKTAWQNIALVAMGAFFIVHFLFPLATNDMCDGIGSDYCVYWTAGRIINDVGYAEVYDLDTLTSYEQEILPEYYDEDGSFHIAAFMYLPIFAVPFQFLSLLDLRLSFIIWNIIILLAFSLYLQFFAKKVAGRPLPTRTFLMIFFSLPILINTYYGQVSIWMAIFVGEFIRALLEDKPLRAGLWLGGLILKPQLLVVLGLFLLLQRLYKTIAGVAITSVAAVGLSFELVRVEGFLNLKEMLLEAAGGGASSAPPLMMNWHMLGSYFALYTTEQAGTIAAIAASLITLGVLLYAFRRKMDPKSNLFYLALLGAMAASEVISWHTHIHMFIALYPIILYLYLRDELSKPFFSFLMLFPALMFFIRQISWGIVSNLEILPDLKVLGLVYIIHSSTFLALNLYLIYWSIRQSKAKRSLEA
jgi:hypothetical protein